MATNGMLVRFCSCRPLLSRSATDSWALSCNQHCYCILLAAITPELPSLLATPNEELSDLQQTTWGHVRWDLFQPEETTTPAINPATIECLS